MEAEGHRIRLAQTADVAGIIEFIRKYWSADHIFVKSPAFFLYQHGAPGRINYVVAENHQTGGLDAILGFIPYSAAASADVCLALWKVGERSGDSTLGLRLLEYVRTALHPRTLSCCGINKKTIPIYQYLEYETGKLQHYYRLNDRLPHYRIAKVSGDVPVSQEKHGGQGVLIPIPSFAILPEVFAFERYQSRTPYKDADYFKKRYFDHPIYTYQVYGIKNEGQINSVLVTRASAVEDARVLRIVDFIGVDEELRGIGVELARLMYDQPYEYIDFYQSGIADAILTDAGFVLNQGANEIIIPNYFEPFEQRNIDIYFFIPPQRSFYMFKADGDQDRPSILAERR